MSFRTDVVSGDPEVPVAEFDVVDSDPNVDVAD